LKLRIEIIIQFLQVLIDLTPYDPPCRGMKGFDQNSDSIAKGGGFIEGEKTQSPVTLLDHLLSK